MWIACHAKSSSPCSLGPPTAAVADDGRRAELRHELTPLSSLTTVEMFEHRVGHGEQREAGASRRRPVERNAVSSLRPVLGFSSKARGLGGRPALTDAAVGCSGENDFEVTAAALEPFRAFLASGAGKVKQGKPAKTPLKDGTNNNAFHVYGRDDLDLVDVPEPAAIIAAATPGARLVCRPGSRSALLHPNSVAPLAAGRWLTVGALGRYIAERDHPCQCGSPRYPPVELALGCISFGGTVDREQMHTRSSRVHATR
jgi:hypothetical protein